MPEDKTLSVINAVVLHFSVVNVLILGVFSKVATVVKIFWAEKRWRQRRHLLTLLRERNMLGSACPANLYTAKHRLENHDTST